jgi:hypothetical protein
MSTSTHELHIHSTGVRKPTYIGDATDTASRLQPDQNIVRMKNFDGSGEENFFNKTVVSTWLSVNAEYRH